MVCPFHLDIFTVKNEKGNNLAYALDAPRFAPSFSVKKKYRYYFVGDWRILIEDNINQWEAKVSLGFSFDDDANKNTAGIGYFKIIHPPRQVNTIY